MVDGIQLMVLAGPAAPLPLPRPALDALESVTVTNTTSGPSVFELKFKLSTRSPLHALFLVAGGGAIPLLRVIIAVVVRGNTEVLIDGVMTDHKVTTGGANGLASLTVTGEDLTRVMDYIDFSGLPYPAMPAPLRVLAILAKYAVLGIVPVVIPSIALDVPIPIERIPTHQGKDLPYVRQLAEEVGYVFYHEAGPVPGVSRAYWGPEIKVGMPQPALTLDMDAHTNVESMTFAYDTEKATLPYVLIHNQATKAPIPIPIPPFTPLNPPLGLIPPIPKKLEPVPGTARMNPVQAVMVGLAKAAKSAEVVTASGSLDVLRYGHVLKARKLVGVRGAGLAFDGIYYVQQVTHTMKRGEFRQNFRLSRNGIVSTVPTVPV